MATTTKKRNTGKQQTNKKPDSKSVKTRSDSYELILDRFVSEAGLVQVMDGKGNLVWRRKGLSETVTLDLDFGPILSRIRENKGLSRKVVAKLLDIPQQTYGRYERSMSPIPYEVLTHFLELMNARIIEIYGELTPQLIANSDKMVELQLELIETIKPLSEKQIETLLFFAQHFNTDILEAEITPPS